jgi:hypothetical protein
MLLPGEEAIGRRGLRPVPAPAKASKFHLGETHIDLSLQAPALRDKLLIILAARSSSSTGTGLNDDPRPDKLLGIM